MIARRRDSHIGHNRSAAGCGPVEGIDAGFDCGDARIVEALQHQQNLNWLMLLPVQGKQASGQAPDLRGIMKTHDYVDGIVEFCMPGNRMDGDWTGTTPAQGGKAEVV